MLNCRACLWRCLHALDAPVPRTLRPRRHVPSAPPPSQQRLFSRAATRYIDTEPADTAESRGPPQQEQDRWKSSTQAAGLGSKMKKALTQQPALKTESPSNEPRKLGRRDPAVPQPEWNRRKRELKHLTDPLELAKFVKQELAKGKDKEMLQLVQMASHNMSCIVSWNHIIDYTLSKGKTSQALKIYNDMKKRAQFPDAYTYSILLRGFSNNAHESGALGKALSVYHSMSAPNSRIEPSIIHTNSMLRVCARANDMDALWGVAAKIPDKGPASANQITYSTIINAIRQSLLVNVPLGESEEVAAARIERGIMEGRRVWEEIIAKWSRADLKIEEELVCAMGRLLLIGARPRDWDDVLSLVEQTMDIPRMVPRLGSPERKAAGYPPLRSPNVLEEYRSDGEHPRGEEFLPLAPRDDQNAFTNPLSYATPSNNTLSMVLEACQKVVANKACDAYWDLLTDPTTYKIVPDINNVQMRLRLLRQNRASTTAVKLFTEYFVEKGITPPRGTFRIAMSTCVRDKNNHNALRNASQLLAIMLQTLEDADAKTVSMYAELALRFPLATGADLIDAISRLQPALRNLRLQVGVGGADAAGIRGAVYASGEARKDVIAAIRKIHAVMQKLVMGDLVSEEEKKPFKADIKRLQAFLQRIAYKDSVGGEDGSREFGWRGTPEQSTGVV